jgi:plastocyanin
MKLLGVITGTVALLVTACYHLPSFSRSGEVRDIAITDRFAITDRLSEATVQVNAGDEIRWTNKYGTPVRITFSDYVLDKLSCRRNFGGHFYSGAEADLQPNESASVCFQELTHAKYVVRMASSGGEMHFAGVIQVGDTDLGRLPSQEAPNAVSPREGLSP